MGVNDKVEVWLVTWFQKRNSGTKINIEDDYYCSHLIDSFGIIELIGELEKKFDIYFDDDEFQKLEFRTIVGLSEIVRRKRQDIG